jgi:putative transposase
MRLIDEEYTRTPFYGYRKLAVRLQQRGYTVNPKRVLRLMRVMGLHAVCPRPRTSIPDQQHKKYPYLLRDMEVTHPNQVWSADITYVPMPQGFMYLVAVIDWFSRFVLSGRLALSLAGGSA